MGMAGAVLLAEQRDVDEVGSAETKEWTGAAGENATNDAGRRRARKRT